MKNEYFESIMTALNESLEYTKGNKALARSQIVTVAPIPQYKKDAVKNIRVNLGLTQRNFANVMGVSSKTVEAWEAGKNSPSGSSSRILQLLEVGGKKFLQEYKILPTIITA